MSISTPSARLLTELDHIRISKLLQRPALASTELAAAIEEVIDGAELISSYDAPPTLVTMYSQVLIADTQTGEQRKLTLCYPDDAEPATGFVSVLSPVGSSLLGLSAGQLATWRMPHGSTASAQILEILFQPEESGDYLL
ncbi:nucleoside diphosphate kinase regulator [Polaromonas jejuensis]|uniref:Nucleoside diphosphate kinase regulator n=1 Tax=Polaromonas jejuensis TaxID=457502 RepID=A0ABW0Q7L5_9BURK|nr:nucleoside diphosphate kinase regulator [Polaromonas jejuensis]